MPPFDKICKNIITKKFKKDKITLLFVNKKYQKVTI